MKSSFEEDRIDAAVKVVICGEAGVGKTNLLLRHVRGFFDPNTRATIGVDFFAQNATHGDFNIKMQFFDTAGTEKYRSTNSQYFRGALGAILVYDITRRQTFEKVKEWLDMIKTYATSDVVKLLIGNKIDLAKNREVTVEEGAAYAESQGCFFMETSALTNEKDCVNKAFEILTKRLAETMAKKIEETIVRESILIERIAIPTATQKPCLC